MKFFLKSLFTLFFALTTLFFALRLTPGDPVERLLGPEAKQEDINKYRTDLGLDQPLHLQYKNFIKGLAVLDLGNSFYSKASVVTMLKEKMKPTLTLAIFSILISTPIGIFLGILSAIKRGKVQDYTIRIYTLLLLSFPIFSLAPILVLLLSIKLGIFPVSEWLSLRHMVLPILTLVLPLSSVIARVMRNKYLEEISSLWVLVLKAKGLSRKQVMFRLSKICLPTILNVVAIQLSVVMAGTIITETIFDIPGVGSLLFEAIGNRDYPVVQGAIAYSTLIYMFVYMFIDYINTKLDPRIS